MPMGANFITISVNLNITSGERLAEREHHFLRSCPSPRLRPAPKMHGEDDDLQHLVLRRGVEEDGRHGMRQDAAER